MTITDLKWHLYRIPFVGRFTTAHEVLTAREGAIVEITTREGVTGIGDICPLPEFGGCDLNTALTPLPWLTAQIQHMTPPEALDYLYYQQETNALPPSTTCGVESALLDVWGQIQRCSLATILSHGTSIRSGIRVNAVIGTPDIEATVQRAQEFVAAGSTCIKLKVGQGLQDEIRRVAAVRHAIGPEIALRLDANEAWSFEQALTILSACSPFAIQYVEQPLRAYDLTNMYRLRQEVSIPIAADEAVYDLESARRILAWEAADVLILKPQLAGGLRMTQQILRESTQRGIQCVITSSLESGVGVLGALQLATACEEMTLECGLATLHLLEDDLLLEAPSLTAGFLALPPDPGLGGRLDRDALRKYALLKGVL